MLRGDRLRVRLRVRPGAKRQGMTGVVVDGSGDARLNMQVSAPPVGGKANGAVVRLLAKRWRVAASRFSVVSGVTARLKVIEIVDADEELLDKIAGIEDTEA